MSSVNKAILIGHLGKDPEIRHSQSGAAIASFSIATNESWNNKEGQREERTEWHRIVAFGKLAEICGQYLSKGKQIYLEGRLQTRAWEDRDGNKRYTTEIVAREMKMLNSQGGGQGQENDNQPPQSEGSSYPPVSDEDIPF